MDRIMMTMKSAAKPAAAASDEADGLVGASAAMGEVRRLVGRVARADATVLITGASGTGKERVARAIHAGSARAKGPFVAINCGAIPRDLLESELFGHEKGSFTGANAQQIGRFEEARGGTLFLDEIGDMPLDMQVKLLRVLEERVLQRVGGRTEIPIDVRIVSATHRDLPNAVSDGSFREDLFYRLAVFPIDLPGLTERIEDIPALIAHFFDRAPGHRATVTFGHDAIARLAMHDWPGNLRELRNLTERAAILYPGEAIGAGEIDRLLCRAALPRAAVLARAIANVAASVTPEPVRPVATPAALINNAPVDLRALVADLEERYIAAALSRSNGVVAEAARLLGLRRTTLIEKMRRYPSPASSAAQVVAIG